MRLTPPGRHASAPKSPQPSVSPLRFAGAVALAAVVVFGWGLTDEPFWDEYAYITQAYYADLFFEGRRDDPAWLDDLAFDLQPLPKYLIGAGFRAARIRMPQRSDAIRWYHDAHTRFGPRRALTIARVPFVAVGVIGVLALFSCGWRIGGRWVGLIAGLLLIADPLYRLHAHRAMSDVPCEAFLIGSMGLALSGLARIRAGRGLAGGLGLLAAAGVCSGLAIACKLNGLLAPMVLAAWCGLGMIATGLTCRARLSMAAGGLLAAATMLVTSLGINPTYTSHPAGPIARPEFAERVGESPWGRFRRMVRYRLETAEDQRNMVKFGSYVFRTPADKLAVFAVQGFGRFGPLGPSRSDSEVRYDLRQDWGLIVWWPIVLVGIVRSFRMGRQQLREGEPPTALALLVWAMVAWAVVAAYLPLAWDRYLLPIQAPNALLASVGLSGILGRRARKAVEV